MGIKFRCPNGHKLNVKSFLAGKKGVCPKCGASMRIPEQSQEAALEESGEEAEERDDLLDEARFPAPGRASAPANGNAAVASRPTAPVAIPLAARPVAAASPVAVPVASSPAADPIAEAPAAIWYVRPPGGDQYGPARGDIMRRWIAEGRVSGDSLVWREGWSDWRQAREVFSTLPSAMTSALPQPPAAPPPAAAAPIVREETPPAASRSTRLTSRYETRKKSGSGMGVAVIVFLGLLCVVLGILLVYFFFNNGITSPAPASQKQSERGRE